MKLLIGLGNPDAEYENTRHNLGWLFLDYLQSHAGGNAFESDTKVNAHISKVELELAGKQSKAILAKPESYVNTTGPIAAKLKLNFKTKNENIVIVQDDLDIPFGKVKLSFNKDSAGHRGVDSIITSLKTKKFYRLRFGTANRSLAKAHEQNENAKNESVKKFVLSKFTPTEDKELSEIFKKAFELLKSPGTWPTQ
jgi:PTH1 family peptidyl-tRNA hydrolase